MHKNTTGYLTKCNERVALLEGFYCKAAAEIVSHPGLLNKNLDFGTINFKRSITATQRENVFFHNPQNNHKVSGLKKTTEMTAAVSQPADLGTCFRGRLHTITLCLIKYKTRTHMKSVIMIMIY